MSAEGFFFWSGLAHENIYATFPLDDDDDDDDIILIIRIIWQFQSFNTPETSLNINVWLLWCVIIKETELAVSHKPLPAPEAILKFQG